MKRLTRTRNGKMIGGVCAGIAKTYGWDPTLVRTSFVLSCLLPGPQIVVYAALWLLIPVEEPGVTVPFEKTAA